MLGQFVDSLPDSALGRVIDGKMWRSGRVLDRWGRRCLIGHVEDWHYPSFRAWRNGWARARSPIGYAASFCDQRFDALVKRFGLARVVHAIKKRAVRARFGHPVVAPREDVALGIGA